MIRFAPATHTDPREDDPQYGVRGSAVFANNAQPLIVCFGLAGPLCKMTLWSQGAVLGVALAPLPGITNTELRRGSGCHIHSQNPWRQGRHTQVL